MSIRQHRIRSLVLALGLVGVTATVRSRACGGDWYPEVQIDPRIGGVAQAEKSLARGDYVAAAGSVIRMMPHVKTLKDSKDPLVIRAERVLAVALERGHGTLALEREVPTEILGHWQGKAEDERAQNLSWSVATLRRQLSAKQDDPGLSTELGEALAQTANGEAEAKNLLESLAARDLIATPQGYQALARLRSHSGDAAGEELALKRCESMAPQAKLCAADHRAS